ncbi:hypothetical protein CR152_05955 [Massilia violaceinigra]|uniref:site-specific DNA-methyltransferase (adenine-specific) n=1 Tax=Massilia violaceinigra TaxID=2045208 RepID=A0A2D2DGN7_9BURK|nr:DNA adenine methylase [Massilia violaceinigra]ATQ74109.1 hypothetical protein CR152_05955 [Massilia violaceinigra]
MVVLISTASKVQANGQLNAFRPIYYLGCKVSLTSAIRAAIDEVDPSGGRMVDLFAGTGVVASAMGASRDVTTVDVQEYSRVICSAVLRPPRLSAADTRRLSTDVAEGQFTTRLLWCLAPLMEHEHKSLIRAVQGDVDGLIELLEAPSLVLTEEFGFLDADSPLTEATSEVIRRMRAEGLWNAPETTVARNFGGVYFSYQQAALLDAALNVAARSGDDVKDALTAVAISTASTLVNTVGKQFAQPIQPRSKSGDIKAGLVKTVQRDRSIDMSASYKSWLQKYADLTPAAGAATMLRDDYLDALTAHGKDFSVVYADPPYTRDHYSRFYHVLETMCLRDNPQISRVKKKGETTFSRGIYREERHQSPFCIRSEAPRAFDLLFGAARAHDLPLVLSYSPHEAGDGTHPRVVSMAQVIDLANAHYKRVEISVVEGMSHNKLNHNNLNLAKREHAEILLKCFC